MWCDDTTTMEYLNSFHPSSLDEEMNNEEKIIFLDLMNDVRKKVKIRAKKECALNIYWLSSIDLFKVSKEKKCNEEIFVQGVLFLIHFIWSIKREKKTHLDHREEFLCDRCFLPSIDWALKILPHRSKYRIINAFCNNTKGKKTVFSLLFFFRFLFLRSFRSDAWTVIEM